MQMPKQKPKNSCEWSRNAAELCTALQIWSRQCCLEGKSHFPPLHDDASPNAAQEAVGSALP